MVDRVPVLFCIASPVLPPKVVPGSHLLPDLRINPVIISTLSSPNLNQRSMLIHNVKNEGFPIVPLVIHVVIDVKHMPGDCRKLVVSSSGLHLL